MGGCFGVRNTLRGEPLIVLRRTTRKMHLPKKADVLDLKAAISEARHDDDETQAPEEVEDHTSTAHQRPIPLEAILSAGAGWSRFGMVWIGNPHKFHLSALYYDPEDLFDGVPMYVTFFKIFFWNAGFFEVSYFLVEVIHS